MQNRITDADCKMTDADYGKLEHKEKLAFAAIGDNDP